MADVRPLRPPTGGGDGGARRRRCGDDRAQLMLVAALAMAVLFVSLALLLNTVIYTGNLATRSVGGNSDVVAEYRTAATGVANESLRRVNAPDGRNYSVRGSTFRATMRDWDDAASRHHAVTGAAAELSVVSQTNGTRLRQDNFSRSFVNASPSEADNWSVAERIGGYRDFSMTVNRSALVNMSGVNETDNASLEAAGAFNVTLKAGGGERYTTFVGTDGSHVVVSVFNSSSHLQTCTATTTGDATVDFSNGAVGGTDCEALTFADDASDPFTLRYENGDAVEGTYSLVVDTPYGEHKDDFEAESSESPYWTRALYGAELRLVYRTPSIHYESNVTVVPDA